MSVKPPLRLRSLPQLSPPCLLPSIRVPKSCPARSYGLKIKPRARSTRRAEWQVQQHRPPSGPPPLSSVDSDDNSLLSTTYLRLAKVGAKDPVPEAVAVPFLTAYERLGPLAEKRAVERLCREHGISPSSLPSMALILIVSPHVPHRVVAKRLLISASALRVPLATRMLVAEGLRRGMLFRKELEGPVEHLRQLASASAVHSGGQKGATTGRERAGAGEATASQEEEGRDIVEAMILQSKIYLVRKQDSKAKELLEHAIQISRAQSPFPNPSSPPLPSDTTSSSPYLDLVAEAHTLLATLHLNNRRADLARPLLEHVAQTYDYGDAWLRLAHLAPEASEPRKACLLRAAAKGLVEAARELAVWYAERVGAEEGGIKGEGEQGGGEAGKKSGLLGASEEAMWAREWFQLCQFRQGEEEGVESLAGQSSVLTG